MPTIMRLLDSSLNCLYEAIQHYKTDDVEAAIDWLEGVPDELNKALKQMQQEATDED